MRWASPAPGVELWLRVRRDAKHDVAATGVIDTDEGLFFVDVWLDGN
jgi:hypothetical protein